MSRTLMAHRVLAALVVAVVLAGFWFTERFTTALDLTASQRHSLTAQSVQVAAALSAPVEVLAVLGPEPTTRQAVRDLVDRYRAVNSGISLAFLNPETDPARARELAAAPGGELILSGNGRQTRLQTVSERALTGALRQLSRNADRRIIFVHGHGERRPDTAANDDWQVIADKLRQSGLTMDSLSMASQPLPDDAADVIVIAGAERDWFAGEVSRLKRWLDDGGHLLWLMEPGADVESLQPIAHELGVSQLPGTVIDTASQAMDTGSPAFVVLDRFPDHSITRGLASPVLLPVASAFAVTPLAGQEERVLLQTPPASWTETGVLDGRIAFDDNSEEVRGPLMLGVTIERLIAGIDQRIAIIGDADFGASQFVGNGANQALVERLLLWLAGSADEIDFVSPAPPDAELSLSPRHIVTLSALLLAGLPLLCLLVAAVLAWRWRRS